MGVFASHATPPNIAYLSSKAEVEEVCPWYFQMKGIIGERPNMKPVGVGNSTSPVDLTILGSGVQGGGSDSEDSESTILSGWDGESQGETQHHTGKNKRSASAAGLDEDIKSKPRTPAHANASRPTAVGSKPKKAKGLDDIVEIAIAEEVSHQKQLELGVQKSKDKASRFRAEAEVKKAAIEAKREREKHTHEIAMMKMQLELAKIQRAAPVSVDARPSQGNIHLPGLCPPFPPNLHFGSDSQFSGAVDENEGVGEGSFIA